MKTIEDLKNWLNEYNKTAPHSCNSIRMYSDGSGYLIGSNDEVIREFSKAQPLPSIKELRKPKEIVVDGVTYVRK